MFGVVSLSQVCFEIFPIDKKIEQRICLKFCIANGISCVESQKMLQKAYGELTLSKTRAYEWYSAFKSARDVVEDLPRSGRPSTSSTQVIIAKAKETVTENRHFPKFKLPLRGTCFQSIEDIKENLQRELKSIPENAFNKCLDDWIIR